MLYKVTLPLIISAFWWTIVFTGSHTAVGNTQKASFKKERECVFISFKLKKKERCFLSYSNQFFEAKTLDFNNSGNSDTVINKKIVTDAPLILTNHIILLKKDNQTRTIKYILLARLGDTLHLSLTNRWYLNLNECKRDNILCDSSNAYYTDDNIIPASKKNASKTEQWQAFYQLFTKRYIAETERINKLFASLKTDSGFHAQLLLGCRLHYYKRLLDGVFEKDSKCFKPCLSVILKKTDEIEQLLDDKNLLSSNELLSVIDGIVRVKIINEHKDYTDGINVYDEASAANLGKFKPAYLAVCIAKSPVKQGPGFSRILNNFDSRYKNSLFTSHIESLLKSEPQANQITFDDPIITLNGATVSWKNLISSKKHLVVIDFWASWCLPCRHQLPVFDSIRTVLHHNAVEFVSINIDEVSDDWENASKAEKEYLGENNYHLLNAAKSDIVRRLKINSIPRYLVLNNDKIISPDYYQPTDPSFVKELAQLIKLQNQ